MFTKIKIYLFAVGAFLLALLAALAGAKRYGREQERKDATIEDYENAEEVYRKAQGKETISKEKAKEMGFFR